MSCTTSRGVKCSPASSLFSSLKRRMSSSNMVPMEWLSSPIQADRFVGVQDGPGAEVYGPIQELLDQVAERIRVVQGGDLVAELELVEDLLDVG